MKTSLGYKVLSVILYLSTIACGLSFVIDAVDFQWVLIFGVVVWVTAIFMDSNKE